MATVWTDEQKERWISEHPCRKKDGTVGRPHKDGKCGDCACCITCPAPPWCSNHARSDKRRKRTIPTNFQLSVKRGRGQAATITPSPVPNRTLRDDLPSPTRRALEEYDQAQEKEKERANSIANWLNDLDTIEALPSTKQKTAKLLDVFQQMINQVAGQNEKKRAKMTREIAEGLEPTLKQATKLNSNLATLIIDGGPVSKRIGKALLLSSYSEKDARKILLDNDYSERRQRIAEFNTTKRGADYVQDEVCNFVSPCCDRTNNAIHRRNFRVFLSKGKDLPPRPERTKISQKRLKKDLEGKRGHEAG